MLPPIRFSSFSREWEELLFQTKFLAVVSSLGHLSTDNYVSPLEDIHSDCTVGIKCDYPGYDTLYILGVYLLSSSLNTEVSDEYFDYMWASYELLSSRGMVLIMGDFNGDLGNSLGDKGKRETNLRGLKLLDFANYINLCPVNLTRMFTGTLETFNSYCGRFHSLYFRVYLSPKLFTEQYQIS